MKRIQAYRGKLCSLVFSKSKLSIISLLFIFLSLTSYAQEQPPYRVEGKVLSATDNMPLPGATVKVKGSQLGTSTGENGGFKLVVPDSNIILTVSFLGYETQKLDLYLPMTNSLTVTLERDAAQLDGVTVSTGYESIPIERATGSFTQPIEEVFENRISTDLLNKIKGITSGLIFNANTGRTINGEWDVSIRGRSTINTNDQPLVVVDNFPYNGDLSSINPNDVESITVLKDAAAASIWGARAGNGVIVITTKKGRPNRPLRISANIAVVLANKPDLFYNPFFLPSPYFIEIENFLYDHGKYSNDLVNSVSFPPISQAIEIMANTNLSSADSTEMISHLKQLDVRDQNEKYFYRNSMLQQYAINMSGGIKNAAFYLSAGFDKDSRSLKYNDVNRISLNSVSSYQPFKALNLTAGIYFAQRKENHDNTLESIAGSESIYYPYTEYADNIGNRLPITYYYRSSYVKSSEKNGFLDWTFRPLNELGQTENRSMITDIRITTGLDYSIWDELKVGVKYQYQKQSIEDKIYHNQTTFAARDLVNKFSIIDENKEVIGYNVPPGGFLENTAGNTISHNLRVQLNYDRSWHKHYLNASAGYEISQSQHESLFTMLFGYDDELATSMPVNSTTFFSVNPSGGAAIPQSSSVSGTLDRFRSSFFLGSYIYDRRYTLTASARIDGSNYFGVRTNQKSVPLWSTGIKWAISEERFYDWEWLPLLNLKVSYGYSGNLDRSTTGVTTFRYMPLARWTNNRYANLSNIGNPDLRWEKIRNTKFGVGFSLRDNIVSGSVEFYFKKGVDLIGTTRLVPSTGITDYRGNYAEMKTRGVDFQLASRNINGKLKWSTILLLSTTANKITKYDITKANSRLVVADGLNGKGIVPIVGAPVYSVYSLPFAGLDAQTGDPVGFLEGQKSKDFAAINNSDLDALVYHGPARPRVFGGLTNTVDYGSFSLSVNLIYKFGYYFRKSSVDYSDLLGNAIIPHKDFMQRWQAPGDEKKTTIPSLIYPVNSAREFFYKNSSALIERGDHVRLQDIILSYTLQGEQIPILPIERVQLYAQANNIGIIWKATDSGLDPDFVPTHNATFPTPFSIAMGVKLIL